MRLSHLLGALMLAAGPVSAQVSAFPREVTYDFAFEINAMPPLGQSNAAIGFGVYSFETWGNWGAYGSYVSTPPEDLGTDLVSDGLAAIFDLEDDPTDDYNEGQLLTIKPFNYDREYTDQTVLSLGLTYKIADGIYGYGGGGVARLRVFEKTGGPNSDFRQADRKDVVNTNINAGILMRLGGNTLNLGYHSGLEQMHVGFGWAF